MGKSRSKKDGRRPDSNLETSLQLAAHESDQTVAKPKPNFAWEELDAIRDEVGVGMADDEGFTIEEYAAHYHLAYQTAAGQLRRMVETGKLIQGWKHNCNPNGPNRRVLCYRSPEKK